MPRLRIILLGFACAVLPLRTAAQIVWSGGDVSTIGTHTISAGASLDITTTANHDYSGNTLTNHGTINWQGGQLRSGNGGGITIAAGGIFNDNASASANNAFGGAATFTNHGTYKKLAAGSTTISQVFDNNHQVLITGGTLLLTGGGTASGTAVFNVGSGAALTFGGGTHTLNPGATIAGTGTTSLSHGALNVASGSASLSNLTIANGTLGGGGTAAIAGLSQSSGSIAISALELTGNSSWIGGNWNGATASTASIAAGATLTLSTTNVKDFDRRAITNHGTVHWQAGQLRTGNNGSFTNAAGATFNDTASSWMASAYGGPALFANAGTYNKSAAGITHAQVPFTNTGAVNVTSGTLQLEAGGSSSGAFNTATGATLAFTNNYTLQTGSTLTGAGTYLISGGTLTIEGTPAPATLHQTGGTATGPGSLTIGRLALSGGNSNVASLTLTDAGSTWTGGTMNGAGTTTVASGASLDLGNHANHDLNGRAFVNEGTVTWNSGYIRGGNGSSFTNAAGALFSDLNSNNYTVHSAYGGAFSFTNHGTYRRNGVNTTFHDVPFHNHGAVEVLSGDLQFRSGGTMGPAGTMSAATGTTVAFTNGYTVPNGTSLSGAGTFRLTGGTLDVGGTLTTTNFVQTAGTLAGTHTLGGTFNWHGGTWSSATAGAVTTVGATATLNLGNGANHDFDRRTISNLGTTNWTSGYIRAGNGSTFVNTGTFVDTQASGWTIHSAFGGSFTFKNDGTYRREAAGTVSYIDVLFTNNGSVQVVAGDLQFRAGGSLASSGTISAAAGTHVTFTNGFTVANGASLTGAGTYWLTNGTLDVTGTMNVSTFNQTNGLLEGVHTLNGLVRWSGGTWNTDTPGRSTTIASTATLHLDGGNNKDFNRREIVNRGTVHWNGGYIRGGNGSVFTNHGTFVDLNPSDWTIHAAFGGTFTFVNHGTYRRDAANTTFIDVPFENNGTVDLRAGNLQFRAGGTLASAGTIAAAAGTHVSFTNGFNVADGASLTGDGTYSLTGGTLTLAGDINVGTFHQTGGNLAGTSTIHGTFNWSGGDWNSATTGPQTTIAAGATLNLLTGSSKDLNRRTVVNQGTTTWSSGYIRGGNGTTFTNAGVFNDRNASGYTVHSAFGGTFTFINHGTYVRDAGHTTYFDTPFDNHGTIDLKLGNLQLRQGGTMSASSVVNAGAGTHFSITNSYTIADGAEFTGPGTFSHTGGTLAINGTLKAPSFNWHAGNWNTTAPATTTIDATTTLNLVSGNSKDLSGRTVINRGTVNWEQGYIRGGDGATLTNAAGATFNDRNAFSYTVQNAFGGTFSFVNEGTYVRNVAGTTYFDVPFHNRGTLDLQQGDLQLRQGGTMTATSVVNTTAGTNFYFTNDYTLLTGARFAGAGNVMQTGGNLTIDGTLKAAAFNWHAGTWNTAAPTTTIVDSSTVLNLVSGNNKDFRGRTIRNDGEVNWHQGYLRGGDGSVFVNAPGGTFKDHNASSYTVHNPFGGSFVFRNQGTYLRDVDGTTYFDTPFENSGRLELDQGSVQLRQGGTMSATSVVHTAAGTNLYLTNNYTIEDGATFTGTGNVWQTGGTLVVDVLRAASFNWDAGNWNSTSPFTSTIAPGSTLNLTSGHNKDFAGRAVVNQGTVNWHAGYLRGGNGSTFTNASGGTFNDRNASSYTVHNPFGGSFSFVNDGTYSKSTAGTTTFDVPFTNNGTLAILGGSLVFHGTFTNTGAIQLAGNAHAHFPAAFTTHAPLTGTGTIHVSAITAAGLVSPGNSPGQLSITGALTLLNTSTLLIELGGANQGTGYDFLSVGGAATLAGSLSLGFLNNFQTAIAPTDTFTILSAASLTGAFANAAPGQRLLSTDGLGSFQVNYGLNAVTLSNFQAIPEPSTYAMIAIGSSILFLSLRRRRK